MSERFLGTINVRRNDPCLCGSGERFRRCCGSLNTDRKIPREIFVNEGFLSPGECDDLVAVLENCPSGPIAVVDTGKSTAEETIGTYDDRRITERVEVGELQQQLDEITRQAVLTEVALKSGDKFEWFEQPHILKYSPGSFYTAHTDNAYYDVGSGEWVRCLDRDWSLLLYLGKEFEGGEILFNNFDFELKPRPGTLVFFPSDSRYMHRVMPITSGMRYALVSWTSKSGVQKICSPPRDAIFLGTDKLSR